MQPSTASNQSLAAELDQARRRIAELERSFKEKGTGLNLAERSEDLALINKLNYASNRGESLKQILRLLAEESSRVFDSQGATVFLLSEDKRYLVMQRTGRVTATARRVERVIGKRLERLEVKATFVPGTLCWQVIQDGQPRVIADAGTIKGLLGELTDNPLLKAMIPQIYRAMQSSSVAVVPLICQRQIIGVMTMGRQELFPARAVERLKQISEQLTVIISHKLAEEALAESEARYRRLIETSPDAIAVCDLKGTIQFANQRAVKLFRYRRAEDALGKNILSFVPRRQRPRVFKSMAQVLKNEIVSGLEFTLVRSDGTTFPGEVSGSMLTDGKGRPKAMMGIMRDVTERQRPERERQEGMNRLRQAVAGTIQAIALTVELRDPYTAGHQQRVAGLARALGEEMGLSDERIEGLLMSGAIHDLGKIHVPSEILSRPGRLSPEEMSIIRGHPRAGYEILKDIKFPWPVAQIVRQHHERMDASGYPDQRPGDDIILEARIVAVADVVEAMASHRPYRPSLGIEAALAEIASQRGRLYDAEVVDACLRLFSERGYRLEETSGMIEVV